MAAPRPSSAQDEPNRTDPIRTNRMQRPEYSLDPEATALPDDEQTAADTLAGAENLFLNRESSWLTFNERVLHEALDDRTPLLERLAFLAIFNSNLDEFIQKRVGGLKRQMEAGLQTVSPDGLDPRDQLAAIRAAILPMLKQQADCYTQVILPKLAEQGIHLLKWSELTDAERAHAQSYFRSHVFPVLTPLAVDPGHPFPFISNLSMSLGVLLRVPGPSPSARGDGERSAIADSDGEDDHLQFARVKVPRVLPRWVRLTPPGHNSRVYRFISLEQIIRHNLDVLFEGMKIEEIEPFRITRNADVERDEEDAEDLLELIEQELRDRRFARVVRLEVDDSPCDRMTKMLMQELHLEEGDVYRIPAEMDYTDLWTIYAEVNRPDLKHESWTPTLPPRLADDEKDIFSVIRAGDVLVHHPYESFAASVERFVRAAAKDPQVVAIKSTLYRTSSDSPFIPELIRAAESGKQVACLVELKARFDEERNIGVAQALEKAGIHVVYGIVGLKTHTKTTVVVRQEADGMRVYAHIGTGNYNSKTANLYTDLGLFTADPALTGELIELFHYLTGCSVKNDFQHLLVAPVNMRRRFNQMIDREIDHCSAWKNRGADPHDPDRPHIIAKMNSLEDARICRKLYEASHAGVRIELLVRGFCCLRPGVEGLSDNITVQSTIGRFLEHSRIYYFHNAGKPEYFIGSADWMYRNLNNRVECITPILQPALQKRLRQILDVMRDDQRQTWDMQPDGNYVQRRPTESTSPDQAAGVHKRLMHLARRESGSAL
jgi:polyphosphate kinase